MKKMDTLLIMLAVAIMASVGIVATVFGMTGVTVVETGLMAATGMIIGLSGIIFGIMSFRFFLK